MISSKKLYGIFIPTTLAFSKWSLYIIKTQLVPSLTEAMAFSPGHITGFFQIFDEANDPLQRGSRGAGFSIAPGVMTKVHIEKSPSTSVRITINGHVAKSALVSECEIDTFLSLAKGSYKIHVEHTVELPIGCGFGSSGAGALSLALALNEALNLDLSRIEAAQIAHVAEVKCKTGLGTVIAETFGGFSIRIKPGAPGVGQIEPIPVDEDCVAACLHLGPISTSKILADSDFRQRINKFGGRMVDELTKDRTTENFMELSRGFAEHVGLISNRLQAVLEAADKINLLCSMTMLGETVFSLISRDQVDNVRKVFNKHADTPQSVMIFALDFEGVRLL